MRLQRGMLLNGPFKSFGVEMTMEKALRFFGALALFQLLGLTAGAVFAQDYPNKPVRIVVPYPPGGGVDVVARIIGQKLSQQWSQQVVIDNRAGASGNIGAESVARALPDGYTLLMGTNGPISINVSLYPKLPFNPLKDFAPVTIAASGPFVLSVHPSIPAKSVKELIALAKARPSQLTFASAGSGSSNHLAGELLKTSAKVDIIHVPYRGGATSISDVLSGRVSMIFNVIPLTLPYATVGKLRPLAVTTTKRFPSMPEIPTMAEAGVPGYDVTPWFGILAPAASPKAVVRKIHNDIVQILGTAEIRESLSVQGFEPIGNTPEQFGRLIATEITKWASVISSTGARID